MGYFSQALCVLPLRAAEPEGIDLQSAYVKRTFTRGNSPISHNKRWLLPVNVTAKRVVFVFEPRVTDIFRRHKVKSYLFIYLFIYLFQLLPSMQQISVWN